MFLLSVEHDLPWTAEVEEEGVLAAVVVSTDPGGRLEYRDR